MELKNFVALAAVMAFILYILLGKNPKRDYLLFVVFAFPVVDLFVVPVAMGGFKVFDIITCIIPFFLLKAPEPIAKPATLYPYFFIILSITILIGALNSEFVTKSLISLMQLMTVFLYAALLLDECYRNPSFFRLIIKGLKCACILSLVFLGLQLIFGLSFALYELNPNASAYDHLIRYPSYFQDPQKYGQFLAICSFLFLCEDQGKRQSFFINALLFGCVILGLFLSGVRAAFTGLCAGMLIVFLFGHAKYKLLGLCCILGGVLVFMFYAGNFAIFNRGAGLNDTAAVRYAYWQGALDIFSHYPLLGIGIGNYQHYVSIHAQHQYWEYFGTIEYMDHPESGYLKFLVETGIIGFATLLGFLLFPLYTGLIGLLKRSRQNNTLLLLIAAVISWMVAFSTVYSFSDLRVFLLVVTILCLILATAYHSRRKIAADGH